MVVVNMLLGSAFLVGGGFALAHIRDRKTLTGSRITRLATACALLGGWYFCLAAIETAIDSVDHVVTMDAPTESIVRIPLPQMPPLR